MADDIAVISDIHGNYTALEAVLAAIDRLEPESIICLGDIVGYGPEPVRCIDAVRRRCAVTLCGNHDYALIHGAEDFNSMARNSIDQHRAAMMPDPEAGGEDEERRLRWEFLKGLPPRHVRGTWLFVHGAPRDPIVEYLRRMDVLLGMDDKISENFALIEWLCFVGHTHRPGVITQDIKFYTPAALGGEFLPLPGQKAIINVGSVGQPRDKDPRACFVTVSADGSVRYHRVEYDVEAVVADIKATPGSHPMLAQRLRRGI